MYCNRKLNGLSNKTLISFIRKEKRKKNEMREESKTRRIIVISMHKNKELTYRYY